MPKFSNLLILSEGKFDFGSGSNYFYHLFPSFGHVNLSRVVFGLFVRQDFRANSSSLDSICKALVKLRNPIKSVDAKTLLELLSQAIDRCLKEIQEKGSVYALNFPGSGCILLWLHVVALVLALHHLLATLKFSTWASSYLGRPNTVGLHLAFDGSISNHVCSRMTGTVPGGFLIRRPLHLLDLPIA